MTIEATANCQYLYASGNILRFILPQRKLNSTFNTCTLNARSFAFKWLLHTLLLSNSHIHTHTTTYTRPLALIQWIQAFNNSNKRVEFMRKIDIFLSFSLCVRSHIRANANKYIRSKKRKNNCAKCRKLLNGTKIESPSEKQSKQSRKRRTQYSEHYFKKKIHIYFLYSLECETNKYKY